MKRLRRLLRKETGTWILAVVALAVGGISIWTSNLLYQSRGKSVSPGTPESAPLAAGCSLNYSITGGDIPCDNVDIVGMSIDRSGSMTGRESDGRQKLAWAKEAAVGFVQTVQNSGGGIDMSVNSFGAQGNDGTGTLGSSYSSTLHIGLTNNYANIINAINNVRYIQSGTCIQCGIRLCNSQVRTSSTDKRVCILLSDGKANHNWLGIEGGNPNPRQQAIDEANRGRALGVQYHVIGYGDRATGGIDETTLRAIAGSTGSYQYKPNVQDWSSAFLQALNNACNSGPVPTGNVTNTPTPMMSRTPTPASGTRLNPTADTYVSSAYPNRNYGSATGLYFDNSPINVTYMKFDLTSLAGRTVNRATLNMYVTNPSSSTGNQNVKNVSGSWTENNVTYSNRPTLGSTIKNFQTPVSNTWVTVDLTDFANANKGRVVSIAIDNASSNGVVVSSRNASTNKPYLLIQ